MSVQKYKDVTAMLGGKISPSSLALLKIHMGTKNIMWNSTNNKGVGGTEDKQKRGKVQVVFLVL